MKNLTIILLFYVFPMIGNATQINYLTKNSYGFEEGGKGAFYVGERQILGDGCEVIDPDCIPFTSSIKTIDAGNLSLPADVYNVSMKVFVTGNTSISKIYTQIQQPYTCLVWRIDTIAKGTWVELNQEMQLDKDVENSSFKLFVSNHPDFGGGKGSFYVDNIQFVLKGNWVGNKIYAFDFMVYPNPATNRIYVESESAGNYKLYNIHGQVVKLGQMPSLKFDIVVSDLDTGLYILQIKSDKGSRVKQLIIK